MSNKKVPIQQLIYQAQNGNKEAKKQILNHYTNYTKKVIKEKYSNTGLNENKLLEAGIDAINYSISKYKNFSSKFSKYVLTNIISGLQVEARLQKNLKTHNKQIKFYITKFLKGDNLAKEEIAKYYIKQIDILIENKYNNENYNKEELKQAGYLGLATAIKEYTKDTKRLFPTFVNHYINSYISKEIKKQKIENVDITIENPYNDFIADIENLELIKTAMNKLKDKKKNVLILHLYYNYTFEEIANMYNLSGSRIRYIYNESLEAIRQEMNGKMPNKVKRKKQSKI